MEKLSNDEKTSRYKKRKILKYLIIVFGLITIVLAVLSLIKNLNPVYALISFIIEAILSKYRDKLNYKDK